MLLKTGSAKGKIVWKGKRSNLSLPGSQAPLVYFSQNARVTVRLMRDDGAPCWESVYTGNRKNVPTGFKAVTP